MIQLLSGELIEFDVGSGNMECIKQQLGEMLSVSPSQLCLIHSERIHEETGDSLYHLFIRPRKSVRLERSSYDFRRSEAFLTTCVNESILAEYLPNMATAIHIFQNPHKKVVQAILEFIKAFDTIERIPNEILVNMAINPSDAIVDVMCTHPKRSHFIFEMCGNRNTRVHQYVIEEHKRLADDDKWNDLFDLRSLFILASDTTVIDYIWDLFASYGCLDRLTYNPSPHLVERWCSRLRFGWGMIKDHNMLATCNHPAILEGLLRLYSLRSSEALAQNQNEIVVDWLLCRPTLISNLYFCTNPNSRAVQYYKENPQRIYWPTFLHNPNPNAVQMSIEWLSSMNDSKKTQVACALSNKNPDLIVWILNHPEICMMPKQPLLYVLSQFSDVDVMFE